MKTIKTELLIQGFIIVLISILFIAIHLRLSQYAFDDAYIHFRVARNLLEAGRPYFNANEIVKVSTSSGWSLFIAALLSLAKPLGLESNFRTIVSIVNSFIALGGMIVFTGVLEKLIYDKLTPARKVLFQVSYLTLLASSSIGLMETPLALLLAGLGLKDILSSRPRGFFWIALAAYVRLELMILLIAVTFLQIIKERRSFMQNLLFLALGLLPILAYDLYFFHTIVPQSIIAKSTIYSLTWLHTLTRSVLLSFPVAFLAHQYLFFVAGLILLFSMLITSVMTLIQNWGAWQSRWIAVFTIWSLVIFCSYVTGQTLMFEWYTPLFTIPLLLAIILCASKGIFPHNGMSIALQWFLFVINLSMFAQFCFAAIFNQGQYVLFESGARVKTYLETGKILYEEYPGATLLTSEIGGLGYTFRGEILDAAGLASPEALAFHPMEIPNERPRGDLGSIPPEYVEQHMPDLIVSFDSFAQALLASNVASQYNMVLIPAYLPEDVMYSKNGTIWGNRSLRIYVRKDLPLSEEIIKLGING